MFTKGAGEEVMFAARFASREHAFSAAKFGVVFAVLILIASFGASRAEAIPSITVAPGAEVYEARGGNALDFTVSPTPSPSPTNVYRYELRGIAGEGSVTGLGSSNAGVYKAPDNYIGRAVVSVRAIDQNSLVFGDGQVIVDVNPATELTAGPGVGSTPLLTNDSTPTFNFRAVTGQTPTVLADATFQCWLDGTLLPCSGGSYTTAALEDGSHTFRVKATRGTGFTDPLWATAGFTVDTTAPVVSITGGPSGRVASTDASFSFTNSDPSATVECKLDAGSWGPCSSPKAYSSLGQGTHSVSVRATDTADNVGSADRNWTVDTVASVSIDSGPDNGNKDATPSFTFSSPPDTGTGFRCRVFETGQTPPPLSICSSPYTSAALNKSVSYTFEVKVTDDLGNTDSKTRVWTQSNTAPSLGSPTVTVNAGETATVDLSADTTDADGDTVGGYTVTSGGSGGLGSDGTRITPGTADASSGVVSVPTAGNAAGYYTFSFSASDGRQDGTSTNGTATVRVRPDTAAITDPSTPISDSTPEWSFTSVSGTTDFECRLLTSADVEVRAWESCIGGTYAPGVVDGTYKIQVRAKINDLVDESPLTSGVVEVDTVSPDVNITGPTSIIDDVDALNNVESPAFEFATTDSDERVFFECRTDADEAGVWTACESGDAVEGLADGNRIFDVRAQDAAGNKDNTDSFAWERDTTEPEFEITSGPEEGDWTNLRRPTWTYTESDPNELGDDKNLLPATTTCQIDSGIVVSDCPSPWTSPSFLNAGARKLTLTVEDTAGNTGTEEINFTVATISPAAFIEETPESPSGPNASFEFMSPSDLGPVGKFQCRISANGGAFSQWADCVSPYVASDLPSGQNTFQVRAADSAGNAGSGPFVASHTWQVIGGTPGTTINASAIEGDHVAFSFSSNDGFATFQCKLDSSNWSPCTSPKTYEDLPYGEHTFQVRAVNQVGVFDPSPAVQVFESTLPQPSDIVLTKKPQSTTSSNFAAFRFGVVDDPNLDEHNMQCRLDGGDWEACDEGTVVFFDLALGQHTFQARAVHKLGVGNNGEPASWTWTVVRDSALALVLPDVNAPDRVKAGKPVNVLVTVRNVGGQDASDASVCLSGPAALLKRDRCKRVVVAAGSALTLRFRVATRSASSGLRANFRTSVEYTAGGEKRKEFRGHVTLLK